MWARPHTSTGAEMTGMRPHTTGRREPLAAPAGRGAALPSKPPGCAHAAPPGSQTSGLHSQGGWNPVAFRSPSVPGHIAYGRPGDVRAKPHIPTFPGVRAAVGAAIRGAHMPQVASDVPNVRMLRGTEGPGESPPVSIFPAYISAARDEASFTFCKVAKPAMLHPGCWGPGNVRGCLGRYFSWVWNHRLTVVSLPEPESCCSTAFSPVWCLVQNPGGSTVEDLPSAQVVSTTPAPVAMHPPRGRGTSFCPLLGPQPLRQCLAQRSFPLHMGGIRATGLGHGPLSLLRSCAPESLLAVQASGSNLE